MIHILFQLLLVALLTLSTSTQAKTVILIHGLDADRSTWYKQRAVEGLFSSGFQDATSTLFIDPKELKAKQNTRKKNDVFYTIDLPWYEPLESQAKTLRETLKYIHQLRKEPLILVGHSTGGGVAILYLLSKEQVPVDSLITIASPHLGSPWAEVTWRALASPMGDFFDLMGADKWSQADRLLWQLSPSVKNNLIHWMNLQSHPNIRYISIVHNNARPSTKMDLVIPAISQNMNYVFALKGHSEVYKIKARHSLSRQDGILLARILGTFKQ